MTPAGRLKVMARDLLWRLPHHAVVNPPLPVEPRSMLFVCLGNICRSPFAAHLAARHLATLGSGVTSLSAGLRVSSGAPPAEAVEVAASYGLSLAEHVPQPLTAELLETSDLVIAMESAQVTHLRAVYPQYGGRVFLLSLYDEAESRGYRRYNIEDPYGQPVTVYEDCYRRIDRAITALLSRFAR